MHACMHACIHTRMHGQVLRGVLLGIILLATAVLHLQHSVLQDEGESDPLVIRTRSKKRGPTAKNPLKGIRGGLSLPRECF